MAFCLRSARKRSNDMPLWQEAPRGEGIAVGLGATEGGLAGTADGACADAADTIVKIAAMVAKWIRSPGQVAGIEVTGSRGNVRQSRISESRPKGNRSRCRCGPVATSAVARDSVRHRERLAPAVLADLALDNLAGVRLLEQRAHAATVDAVRRVLVFRLLSRHFLGGLRPRYRSHQRRRDQPG